MPFEPNAITLPASKDNIIFTELFNGNFISEMIVCYQEHCAASCNTQRIFEDKTNTYKRRNIMC